MKCIKKRTTMLLLGLLALILTPYSTVYAKEDVSIQIESTTESVDYLDLSKKFDEIDHGELDRYIDHLAQKETPTQIDEETLMIAIEVALRPVKLLEHSYTSNDLSDLIETVNESAYSDQTKEKSTTFIQDAKEEYDLETKELRKAHKKPFEMGNLLTFLSFAAFFGLLFLLITGR